jgi:hypothetical protein
MMSGVGPCHVEGRHSDGVFVLLGYAGVALSCDSGLYDLVAPAPQLSGAMRQLCTAFDVACDKAFVEVQEVRQVHCLVPQTTCVTFAPSPLPPSTPPRPPLNPSGIPTSLQPGA